MRRSLTLLVALVATILFTSTPATADDPAKATVTVTAEQELEAEIAYRCVLYSAHMEASGRADMWYSLDKSAILMASTDEATQDGLFDRFKRELRTGIDSTPYELDFESLKMQLARSRDDFDFDAVELEVSLIWIRALGRMDVVGKKIRDNDRRLERDNPAVLRAPIPDSCPSAQ